MIDTEQYTLEQEFTDKYGDSLMKQVAYSFFGKDYKYERVTDRELQISGVDYFVYNDNPLNTSRIIKQKIDLKIDRYKNDNFAFELCQQYSGKGEESWIQHDGRIYIVYFKLYTREAYIYRLPDLKNFMNTDTFKNRKTFETKSHLNGKHGQFKNFRLDELSIHHVVKIDLPLIFGDRCLELKESLPNYKLYENTSKKWFFYI